MGGAPPETRAARRLRREGEAAALVPVGRTARPEAGRPVEKPVDNVDYVNYEMCGFSTASLSGQPERAQQFRYYKG